MPLEDELSDILKKSRRGQGMSLEQLAAKCGVPESELSAIERGTSPSRTTLASVSQALHLKGEPLAAIALEQWMPAPTPVIAGIETVRGDIGGYEVKGYVVHDHGEAMLVDTGFNAAAMLALLDRLKVRLVGICLTHGHDDHSGGLDRLLAASRVPVYLGTGDVPLMKWHPPEGVLTVPHDGQRLSVGRLSVECLTTPGHTPGGICYRLTQDDGPVCFVGDTLFAGSIGGSNPTTLYGTHLESVRTRVLTLPEDTVLFPGHGPSTTVREERTYNPFGTT